MQRRTLVQGALALQIGAVIAFAVSYNALDFFIYTLGGHVVGDGDRLYLQKLAAHWFTYPPFAAVAFWPLAHLPLEPVRVAWELASVGALALACRNVLALAGWRSSAPVVMAALFLEPVWHSLFLGQINLVLLALVLIDVRRVSVGKWAGAGIGVAAALKLTPAIFVVLLLLAGRVRAAAIAAGTFVACTLLGFAVAPDASRLYWTRIFYDTTRVGAPYISNQSPYGAAIRILGGRSHVSHWFFLVPVTLAVFGLAVAALWARRGDWLRAVAAGGITGLLTSPISWSHHWVWALPVLVVLARDARRGWLAGGYVLFLLAPMWWTPRGYGWHGLVTIAANAYLIAGLTALVYLGWQLRCSARDEVQQVAVDQLGEGPADVVGPGRAVNGAGRISG